MDLSELGELQRRNLLYPEQEEALNGLIELVQALEDIDNGLPLSLRGFWEDSTSHKIKVDEQRLKIIEHYLETLGMPYAKDSTSIIVDKYDLTARRYSGRTSKKLHFTLNLV